jgi:hypothetical protein
MPNASNPAPEPGGRLLDLVVLHDEVGHDVLKCGCSSYLEHEQFKIVQLHMKAALASVLFCWLAAGSGFAQPASSPATGGLVDPLAVQIWPRPGREVFRAPANIPIGAYVTLRAPAHAGEVVNVEFFANTNSLGSRQSVWHDAIRPPSTSGQAMPMFIMAPGFYPARLVWSNAPAGSYVLMTRATGTNGLSAVSPPVNLTVLP